MQEKRTVPRRDIQRAAKIELHDGTTVDCTLADVSQTGARITVSDASTLPEEFTLVLRDDLRRRCRAIRRGDNSLGVKFVAESAALG